MTELSAADSAAFEERLADRNAASLRLEVILGIVFIPLFWLVDVQVMPERTVETALIRGACVVLAVILALLSWRSAERFRSISTPAAFVFTQLVGASISIMCWLHDGFESPYYAGLSLLVVSVGFLFAWPARRAVPFYLGIYGFYMSPMLVGALGVEDAQAVVTNQAFLLAIIAVTGISQEFRYRLVRSDFFAQRQLQQARSELEGALESLKALDRAKSEFFGNITHELRTPMTMILPPVEVMLGKNDLDDAERATLELVQNNALKLLKLINDLLDLSKMDERFLRLTLKRMPPIELVGEIVEFSRPLAAQKDIDLTMTQETDLVDIHVDPDKLERAIVNLLSNALKFTPAGGKVTVSLSSEGGELIIAVSDSGIGIAAEKLGVIFERFSQADASTTRKYGGTGIGLAFAKQVVDLHGGRITVESTPGEGSTFSIHLHEGRDHYTHEQIDRRQEDRGAEIEQRSDDQGPRQWSREIAARKDYRFFDIVEVTERRRVPRRNDDQKTSTIVIVEDNLKLLQFVHAQLTERHSVYVAEDGRDGLALIRKTSPDLVVTDYMMPEMNGIKMVAEMRKDPELATIPVVMLTAKGRLEDRIAGREAGADAYLAKPFEVLELHAVIDRLLQRRAEQETEVRSAQGRSLELISAGLAHELHNPLSFLKNAHVIISEKSRAVLRAIEADEGVSEQTQNTLQKPVARIEKMLEVSDRGIARIEHIVELIRAYAREGYPDSPTRLVFDQVVTETMQTSVHAPDGVTLYVDLEAGGAEVSGLFVELAQVVRNLVQNAIDAVSSVDGEATVDVSTKVVDGELVFEVKDTGPGIPDGSFQQIFAPFYSTKPTNDGMGLGLAITHQVVTVCGGEIDVSNRESGGAWFTVRLPIAD